jgi:pentatricopeptide repeat protein
MKRISVFLLFFLLILPAVSSGQELYEDQLDKGIRNSEPYSYLLIEQAQTAGIGKKNVLREALQYSPDLPAVYFELSKASFSLRPESVFEAFDYIVQGIAAYKRNFWWSFMLISSLLTSLLLSFFLSILTAVVIRLPRDIPLLSHDIQERRTRLLILLLLVFALFGPLFFIGALLIIIAFYMKKWDRTVLYLYLIVLLLSPFVFKAVSVIFNAPTSGELKAVVQVNEAQGNTYALTVLNGKVNPVEVFSYALALKHEGRYGEAINAYNKILALKPDPRTYNNLANCYVALNDFDRAKELYQKAIKMKPLPSALYNLSQSYRVTLNFDKGEEYFLSAQRLDNDAVLKFRSIAGRNPNRFVVDEGLPVSDLLKYAVGKSSGASTLGLSTVPLMAMPIIALLMGILFLIMNRYFENRAYRCNRCGKILCYHCEKHLLWRNMCLQCYRSLIKLDELDAKERISRLLTVYEYQKKRRTTIKSLSFFIPGSGQLYAGNILSGFLFLWPFLFFLSLLAAGTLFVTEMSGFSHLWLNMISAAGAVLIYILSNVITRRRLAKGWL